MSDLEKINIYVPEHIGKTIDSDARMFEIFKKDGKTINRNKFVGMLVLGYYDLYTEECRIKKESIVEILEKIGPTRDQSFAAADIILNKLLLPVVPSRKGKNPVRVSYKPTNATEGIISNINSSISSRDAISQYLCRLILSYCERPFSERERIIFSNNYHLLEEACSEKKPIMFTTIWNKKTLHKVIPYRIATGQEELFNYLLCAELNDSTGIQEARSYRLNRITNISAVSIDNIIEDSTLKHLKMMLLYGPQYAINDDEIKCVLLSDDGERTFNRIYYGRPIPDHIEDREEGHFYYFNGSKDQLFLYFRRFSGDEAQIVLPNDLRDKIISFHRSGVY